MEKYSKAAVAFEHPATGKDHCGQCKHFEVHGPRMCEIVFGKIMPQDWCKKFERSYRMTQIFKKSGGR